MLYLRLTVKVVKALARDPGSMQGDVKDDLPKPRTSPGRAKKGFETDRAGSFKLFKSETKYRRKSQVDTNFWCFFLRILHIFFMNNKNI